MFPQSCDLNFSASYTKLVYLFQIFKFAIVGNSAQKIAKIVTKTKHANTMNIDFFGKKVSILLKFSQVPICLTFFVFHLFGGLFHCFAVIFPWYT